MNKALFYIALAGALVTGCEKYEQEKKAAEQKALDEAKAAARAAEALDAQIKKFESDWNAEYQKSSAPIYARVLEVHVGMRPIQDSKAGDASYVILARTEPWRDGTNIVPSGMISVNVIDGYGVTRQGIEVLVEKGTRIKFQRGNLDKGACNRSYCIGPENSQYWGFYPNHDSYLNPDDQAITKSAGLIKVISDTKAENEK